MTIKDVVRLPDGITWEERNKETIESFHTFCKENPQLRFWQALLIWSGKQIYLAPHEQSVTYTDLLERDQRDSLTLEDLENSEKFIHELSDPFYWEGKDGRNAA